MTQNTKRIRQLVEAAVMIALATVLSVLKLVDMPCGGSVTFASMLPLVVISYRHGVGFGVFTGLAYGVIQQLLGLENLSYVTGWHSVVAVMLLDYLVAFLVVGLSGVFKNKVANGVEKPTKQAIEIALGALLAGVLRYICHTLAGAVVWAELSVAIPTAAALLYSIGYNATYMIPETVVLVCAAYAVGEAIDFTRDVPRRFSLGAARERGALVSAILSLVGKALIFFAVCFDACMLAAFIQDPESGSFTLAYLAEANWLAIGIVSVVAFVAALSLFIVSAKLKSKAERQMAEIQ